MIVGGSVPRDNMHKAYPYFAAPSERRLGDWLVFGALAWASWTAWGYDDLADPVWYLICGVLLLARALLKEGLWLLRFELGAGLCLVCVGIGLAVT